MNYTMPSEITVMPGIRIKYGKGGIQTTLSYTHLEDETDVKRQVAKLKDTLYKPYDPVYEIKSKSIDQLTSASLLDFKKLLLASDKQYAALSEVISSKNVILTLRQNGIKKIQNSFFKFLYKRKEQRLQDEAAKLAGEISSIESQIPLSIVSLEIDAEEIYQDQYRIVEKAFRLLMLSEKKWDVTSSKRTDMFVERTSATSVVTRTEIELSQKALNLLRSDFKPLCFNNANGGDLYLYPGFLVVHESHQDFAIIDYTELQISFRLVNFQEEDKVPGDTKVIGKTWLRVNKDGSPDRRFSNNYQIPIVEYGELHFSTDTGLNEKFSFSNGEIAELFGKAFDEYIDVLKTARGLLNAFK